MAVTSSQKALIENIRLRLAELRLSQAELARRIGRHDPYVSDILRGKKSPGLDIIDRIAQALETDTPDLLTPVEEKISA